MTVLLGLVGALLFAASDLAAIRATRAIGAALSLAAILVLGLPFAAAAVVASDASITFDRSLLFAALGGAAYYAAQGTMLRGARDGNVSVVAPIASLEGGVASLIAVGLGERLSTVVAVGVVVGVAGAVICAYEPGSGRATGAGCGVLAALLFGLAIVLWAAAGPAGVAVVVLVGRVSGALVVWPVVARTRNAVRAVRSLLPLLVGTALLELGAIGATTWAVSRGPVSIASVCQSQYGTLGAMLALLLLRERPARTQLAGVALTAVGVALMAGAS